MVKAMARRALVIAATTFVLAAMPASGAGA